MGNFTLPVDDDQVIVLGIMSALELEAASELSMFLDNRFRAESHPEWGELLFLLGAETRPPDNTVLPSPEDLRPDFLRRRSPKTLFKVLP